MKQLAVLVCLSLAGYWSILQSPLFYLDDALRVVTHTSINQGVHGRPIADWLYFLLSGGTFLDVSPLSQILALAFMLAGSLLIAHAFVPQKKASWHVACFALLFVLLPLHYSVICFRYDSFGIGVAVFCAGAAFFLVRQGISLWRFLGASLLFLVTLSIYQPMCGIYFCACCMLLSHNILREKLSLAIRRFSISIAASLCGGFLYIPVYLHAKSAQLQPFYGLPNHPYTIAHSAFGTTGSFLATLGRNIKTFLDCVGNLFGSDLISFCIAMFIAMAFHSALAFRTSHLRKLSSLLCMGVAFLSCGAIQFLLREPIFPARTLTPLCLFVFCLLLFSLSNGTRWCRRGAVCLALVCILSSAGVLTTLGNALRDQQYFNEKMVMQPLSEDFSRLFKEQGSFSFFVANSSTLPLPYSLAVLRKRYSYIDHQSGFFTVLPFLSLLPLTYDLEKTLSESYKNLAAYPRIVSRLGYTLYRVSPSCYAIEFNTGYVPELVTKFQTD